MIQIRILLSRKELVIFLTLINNFKAHYWGFHNQNIKDQWFIYLNQVDNIPSLYLAAMFFCEKVDEYMQKKIKIWNKEILEA